MSRKVVHGNSSGSDEGKWKMIGTNWVAWCDASCWDRWMPQMIFQHLCMWVCVCFDIYHENKCWKLFVSFSDCLKTGNWYFFFFGNKFPFWFNLSGYGMMVFSCVALHWNVKFNVMKSKQQWHVSDQDLSSKDKTWYENDWDLSFELKVCAFINILDVLRISVRIFSIHVDRILMRLFLQ